MIANTHAYARRLAGGHEKRARTLALRRLAAVLAVYVGEVPGKPLAYAIVRACAWSLGYNRNLFNRLRQTEFCVDLLNSDVDARSTTFAGIGIHEDCSWDG
ncbi:hypothetical protein [Achromobacter anxifer]|uniref:hypothetical protein n=1 Tax=Achromobacter anxifer TaxID=1287737 RepID=UPI001582A11A|nr:hypothetical protein [Achromobacter anxifer]MDF8361435.1 hypothetical protein [Achromobacter anxifer]